MTRIALTIACALLALPAGAAANDLKFPIYHHAPGFSGSADYELAFTQPAYTCGERAGSTLSVSFKGSYRWATPKRFLMGDMVTPPVRPFPRRYESLYYYVDKAIEYRISGEAQISGTFLDRDCDGNPIGTVTVSCRVPGSRVGTVVFMTEGAKRGKYRYSVLPISEIEGIVRLDGDPKGCTAASDVPRGERDWQEDAIRKVVGAVDMLPVTVQGSSSPRAETRGRMVHWTLLSERIRDPFTIGVREMRRKRTVTAAVSGGLTSSAAECARVVGKQRELDPGEVSGCRQSLSWRGKVAWTKRCGLGTGRSSVLTITTTPGYAGGPAGLPSFSCDGPRRR
jgi:hypothetical protein